MKGLILKLHCFILPIITLSLLGCGPGSASTDESDFSQESPDDASLGSESSALLGTHYAFQANTGILWVNGQSTGYKMAPGTNPAIQSANCYAFQSNTGQLVVVYNGVSKAIGPMAPKTSPSATTYGRDCLIAAQGSDGNLYTYWPHTGQLTNQQLGMAPRTSPSVSSFLYDYTVAFQANTGNLYTLKIDPVKYRYVKDHKLGMAPDSSPSVTTEHWGTTTWFYVIAFRANTGELYTVTEGKQPKNWGLGIAPGTSPSISTIDFRNGPEGGFVVAFNASGSNDLWTVSDLYGTKHWSLGMAPNTSPVIAGDLKNRVLFQANTGRLYELDWYTSKASDLGNGMAKNTSPSMN